MRPFFQMSGNTVDALGVVNGFDDLIEKTKKAIEINGNENNLSGCATLLHYRASVLAILKGPSPGPSPLEAHSEAVEHSTPVFR